MYERDAGGEGGEGRRESEGDREKETGEGWRKRVGRREGDVIIDHFTLLRWS